MEDPRPLESVAPWQYTSAVSCVVDDRDKSYSYPEAVHGAAAVTERGFA